MADSLKARLQTSFEAELIRDLDLADPVRDIALDAEGTWDSAAGDCQHGGANRIWVKELTWPVGVGGRYVFDLLNGTYGPVGGPFLPMLDGFGQTVTFEQVALLQIEGIAPNEEDDSAYLTASATNNWNVLLEGFVPASFIRFRGLGKLLFSCGNTFKWDVAAAAGIGYKFDIAAIFSVSPTMSFRIIILGWHS